MKNLFYFILCFLSCLSCVNKSETNTPRSEKKNSQEDSIHKSDSLRFNEKNSEIDSTYTMLTATSSIVVKSYTKIINHSSEYFKKDSTECIRWLLSNKDIERVLQLSTPIDEHELHYYYDVFPCYYTGKVSIDGKVASFKINAGAFSSISFSDTTVILGYKKNDYKKYFLRDPGIE